LPNPSCVGLLQIHKLQYEDLGRSISSSWRFRERERERTPRAVYQIQTKTIIKWVWGLVLGTGVSQRLVPASSSSFDFFLFQNLELVVRVPSNWTENWNWNQPTLVGNYHHPCAQIYAIWIYRQNMKEH